MHYFLALISTQLYRCVVVPPFDDDGLLPPGIHVVSWSEIVEHFGWNGWRRELVAGLREALVSLAVAGCKRVYVDGSFVTAKQYPGDFDACWEERGIDPAQLDPVLLTFDDGRRAQKAKFRGELFPASVAADINGSPFVCFFQVDRDTGRQKGIVALDLNLAELVR